MIFIIMVEFISKFLMYNDEIFSGKSFLAFSNRG